MPPKRGKAGKRRRPTRRQVESGGLSRALIARTSAAPDKMVVVLPYYDYYAPAAFNGSTKYAQLNINSCFDPDQTSWARNAQPFSRDQWAVFYNRYIVHRARVVTQAVVCNSALATPPGAATFACSVLPSALADLSVTGAVEESRVTLPMKMINQGGPSAQIDTGWMDLAAVVGRTKAEYRANDTQYGAGIGSTPSAVILHTAACTEIGGFSTLVQMQVTLYVEVEFYDRKDPGLSVVRPPPPPSRCSIEMIEEEEKVC